MYFKRTLLKGGGVGGWVPSESYSRKLPQKSRKQAFRTEILISAVRAQFWGDRPHYLSGAQFLPLF